MNILFSTGSVRHLDPELAFWLAHMGNFDAVELLIDARWAKLGPDVVQRFTQQYQMPVRNIHSPFDLIERWGDYWGNVRQSLDWAKQLGARLLNVHPYAPLALVGRRGRLLARRLEGLRDAAAPLGVTVTLENLPRPGNPFTRLAFGRYRRFESVAALARRAGVKITLDTAHLATWGRGIVGAFTQAADLVANIHLSDYAPGRQHLLPKQGQLPLGDLLTEAYGRNWKEPIVLEICPQALGERGVEQCLPILILARKWLQRHAGR